jgi:hypothetical protein
MTLIRSPTPLGDLVLFRDAMERLFDDEQPGETVAICR